MSRLTRDGTVEPISRDQILRRERGQGNIHFPIQLTTSRMGDLVYPVDSIVVRSSCFPFLTRVWKAPRLVTHPYWKSMAASLDSRPNLLRLRLSDPVHPNHVYYKCVQSIEFIVHLQHRCFLFGAVLLFVVTFSRSAQSTVLGFQPLLQYLQRCSPDR